MNRFNKICQAAALGCSAYIGWTCSQSQIQESQGKTSNFFNLPYETVAAATSEGSLQLQSDYSPEPAPNAPRISQIMRFGFPSLSNIRSLDDYIISYDSRNRIPSWVFEHLTADSLVKNNSIDRSHSEFHQDTSVHKYFRSQNSDYKHSGFDRGHMAAAGNHRKSQKDCNETFVLSNMAPQVGKGFNRDKWNDLEKYCRGLTKDSKNVYVCTGPLYLPRLENDGKLYVKYQVIGQNHVAVPTHFFKVVVIERNSGALELESFLLPNKSIDNATPLETFHVDAEIVERASGLLMFDKISRDKFAKINRKALAWF